MPIYEYEPTLFHEAQQASDCCYFETLQPSAEPALIHCPTCGHAIHRAISAFSAWSKSIAQSNAESASTSGNKSVNLQDGAFQERFKGLMGQINETGLNANTANQSSSNNIAKLVSRHICSAGCKH